MFFFSNNNAREMCVFSLRRGKVYMGGRQKAHSQLHPTHKPQITSLGWATISDYVIAAVTNLTCILACNFPNISHQTWNLIGCLALVYVYSSMQFSSLGSLDEKWMSEFTYSLSAGKSDDGSPLGIGKPMIVWPTVEDVRGSIEVLI